MKSLFRNTVAQTKKTCQKLVVKNNNNVKTYVITPMTVEQPGTPKIQSQHEIPTFSKTPQVTTLNNGIRVISKDSTRGNSIVSIKVNAGTRDVSGDNQGAPHYASKMFFAPTTHRTGLHLISEMNKTGGRFEAQHGREEMVYQVEVARDGVARAMELAVDSVLYSRLHPYDIVPKQAQVAYDVAESKLSPQYQIKEALHKVAFTDQGLGQPLLAYDNHVDKPSLDSINEFMNTHYIPSNIEVIGTNINHEDLVEISKQLLEDEFAFQGLPEAPQPRSTPNIVGGHDSVYETRFSTPGNSKNFMVTGFTAPGRNSTERFATKIIVELLGTGSIDNVDNVTRENSNTELSRLARDAKINHYQAYHFEYSDCGLFGIYTESESINPIPQNTVGTWFRDRFVEASEEQQKKMVEAAINRVITRESVKYDSNIGEHEFLLQHGDTMIFDQFVNHLRAVTPQDVNQQLQQLFGTHAPATVIYGNLN